MLKIICLINKRSDISISQFRSHYEEHHQNLVVHVAAHILSYTRSYCIEYPESMYAPNTTAGERPLFDVVTELHIENQHALNRVLEILRQPDVAAERDADEKRFMDQASIRMFICEEEATDLSAFR